jgi:hypothetical protein
MYITVVFKFSYKVSYFHLVPSWLVYTSYCNAMHTDLNSHLVTEWLRTADRHGSFVKSPCSFERGIINETYLLLDPCFLYYSVKDQSVLNLQRKNAYWTFGPSFLQPLSPCGVPAAYAGYLKVHRNLAGLYALLLNGQQNHLWHD